MEPIRIESIIRKPVSDVWRFFTEDEHITQWNFADSSWHCPSAENDLSEGGRFSYRMEEKNGNMAFDYSGSYDEVVEEKLIKYHLDDDRKVEVNFNKLDEFSTQIIQQFEPDSENSGESQQQGWKAILNNFKNYAESHP